VKKPDGTGRIIQPLAGVFEVPGVHVAGQEQARRAEQPGDGRGVAAAAEGAIDKGLARPGGQRFENFVEEDGVVAGRWQIHARAVVRRFTDRV